MVPVVRIPLGRIGDDSREGYGDHGTRRWVLVFRIRANIPKMVDVRARCKALGDPSEFRGEFPSLWDIGNDGRVEAYGELSGCARLFAAREDAVCAEVAFRVGTDGEALGARRDRALERWIDERRLLNIAILRPSEEP